MERIICLVVGYLFGIIQTGFIYGKLMKIDIRQHGSGNAGATTGLLIFLSYFYLSIIAFIKSCPLDFTISTSTCKESFT